MWQWVAPEQVGGLPWWPVALVIAILVLFNLLFQRVAPTNQHLLWSIGGTFGLLAIGLLELVCYWCRRFGY